MWNYFKQLNESAYVLLQFWQENSVKFILYFSDRKDRLDFRIYIEMDTD